MTPQGRAGSGDAPDRAWRMALDRLEHDLDLAERALTAGDVVAPAEAWVAPADLGPVPGALRGRAEEILARQCTTAAKLAGWRDGVLRRQALVERVSHAMLPSSRRPVYLDVTA